MVDVDLLDKYEKISDSERVRIMKAIINYDMPPLSVLFAILIVLEPKRIKEILEKMG